jgi:hypothetical protein
MFVTANGNPCDASPASPVIQNRIPSWFIKRMRRIAGPRGQSVDELNLIRILAIDICGSTTWIDHIGKTRIDNREMFVSEPYLRTSDDFSCVEEIAELLECELVVDDQSFWYPGKTIRLLFRPKQDDKC